MAMSLLADDPVAIAVAEAIRSGNVEELSRLLSAHSGLATASIEAADGSIRSLLHVATDWPGNTPNIAVIMTALIEAGADINARFVGAHRETPLHWAASSDDVAAIDALLDAGADINADGGVIGEGTPLADARAFKQWAAARRLIERGADVTLADAATLGLMDRLRDFLGGDRPPSFADLNGAFWNACHGGQEVAAAFLLDQGADINWIAPWSHSTPLDAAKRGKAAELVDWLTDRGARSVRDL